MPLEFGFSMLILHIERDDENMTKPKKVVGAALLVCIVLISVGSAGAIIGNQDDELYAVSDMLQEQTSEQLKDGSCCECPGKP